MPVILCGGSGIRLWPLSRSGFPKQFLVLSDDGSNQSLFSQAIGHIHSILNQNIALGKTFIVTNEEHRFYAFPPVLIGSVFLAIVSAIYSNITGKVCPNRPDDLTMESAIAINLK